MLRGRGEFLGKTRHDSGYATWLSMRRFSYSLLQLLRHISLNRTRRRGIHRTRGVFGFTMSASRRGPIFDETSFAAFHCLLLRLRISSSRRRARALVPVAERHRGEGLRADFAGAGLGAPGGGLRRSALCKAPGSAGDRQGQSEEQETALKTSIEQTPDRRRWLP
jgi:hypothetical protein